MNALMLFVVGVLTASVGSILMKRGAADRPGSDLSIDYVLTFIGNPYILCGFIFYFIPALIWVYLLS